ncbi:rhodanese-like domain-containing protein [Campylobacter sp.]|uniref:rhodanese-like domain-containing protein n=1 Tax=Campylobacter sp. TaxID=205 RepID=UPI002704D197|nr:rhodanese-like domain-containing protein [Campylobacter sp.]
MPKPNFNQITNIEINPKNAESFEQLIDIRTPYEWLETGVVKGAKLVYFYDNDRIFNPKFLDEILAVVDPNKPVALICRRGVRSLMGAEILASSGLFKEVINLSGGMAKLLDEGYHTQKTDEI